MTKAQFAASIKAKYPAYRSLPDDQLVEAILQKFPVYASQIEPDTPSATSLMADAKANIAAGNNMAENGQQKEPDTYAGGFVKGLKDYYAKPLTKLKAALQDATAPPNSLGDLASKIALYMAPEFGGALKDSPAMVSLGDGGKGLDLATAKNQLGQVLSGVGDFNFTKPLKSTIGKIGLKLQKAPTPAASGPGLIARTVTKHEGSVPIGPPKALTGDVLPAEAYGMDLGLPAPTSIQRPQTLEPKALPPGPSDARMEELMQIFGGRSPAESENIQRGASFSNGGVYPEGLPTELRDEFGGSLPLESGERPPSPSPGAAAPETSSFPPAGGQGDWHSGLEPGSTEAKGASSLHRGTRELDDLYRLKLSDPLAALLLSLGGGGLVNSITDAEHQP